MTTQISNQDDVIDSRDVIARIEVLTNVLSDSLDEAPNDKLAAELKALQALAQQGEGCADWGCGEQLIKESYFVEYIKELIADCYIMPAEISSGEWPYRHMKMDYVAAAKEARVDYTEIDFAGTTYLIRS